MFMPLLAEFSAWHYLYTLWLSFLSIFLILIILVQRGRGGGLTGALGGMGGQSAFGTKAGDLFTKITIGVAIVWVLSTMLIIKYVGSQSQTGGLSTATTSGEPVVKKEGKTDKSKVDDKKEPESKAPAKTSEKKPAETKTPESKTPAKPAGEK
jgi:preprotein translocase subunit SecG